MSLFEERADALAGPLFGRLVAKKRHRCDRLDRDLLTVPRDVTRLIIITLLPEPLP
jgi:hypothetical protein